MTRELDWLLASAVYNATMQLNKAVETAHKAGLEVRFEMEETTAFEDLPRRTYRLTSNVSLPMMEDEVKGLNCFEREIKREDEA